MVCKTVVFQRVALLEISSPFYRASLFSSCNPWKEAAWCQSALLKVLITLSSFLSREFGCFPHDFSMESWDTGCPACMIYVAEVILLLKAKSLRRLCQRTIFSPISKVFIPFIKKKNMKQIICDKIHFHINKVKPLEKNHPLICLIFPGKLTAYMYKPVALKTYCLESSDKLYNTPNKMISPLLGQLFSLFLKI